MKRRTIPKFASDREAAAFWDHHSSTSYLHELEEVTVKVLPALRRQIVTRAKARRGRRAQGADDVPPTEAVTVRLAPKKLAAVRTVADRKSVPCEDLIEQWITAGLKRERSGKV